MPLFLARAKNYILKKNAQKKLDNTHKTRCQNGRGEITQKSVCHFFFVLVFLLFFEHAKKKQTGAKMAVTQGDHAAELAQRVTDMYARIPPPNP